MKPDNFSDFENFEYIGVRYMDLVNHLEKNENFYKKSF